MWAQQVKCLASSLQQLGIPGIPGTENLSMPWVQEKKKKNLTEHLTHSV